MSLSIVACMTRDQPSPAATAGARHILSPASHRSFYGLLCHYRYQNCGVGVSVTVRNYCITASWIRK